MQRKETFVTRENLKVKAHGLNLRHICERSERPCTSNLAPRCSAPSPAAPPFAVGHTALLSEAEERRVSTRHIPCPGSPRFIMLELSSYFTDMCAAHLVP